MKIAAYEDNGQEIFSDTRRLASEHVRFTIVQIYQKKAARIVVFDCCYDVFYCLPSADTLGGTLMTSCLRAQRKPPWSRVPSIRDDQGVVDMSAQPYLQASIAITESSASGSRDMIMSIAGAATPLIRRLWRSVCEPSTSCSCRVYLGPKKTRLTLGRTDEEERPRHLPDSGRGDISLRNRCQTLTICHVIARFDVDLRNRAGN